MATSKLKQKTENRLSPGTPTSWDTWIRGALGTYSYLASGSGTNSRPNGSHRVRQWWTYGGPGTWKSFRAANGYLPTQGYSDDFEFFNNPGTVSTYYYLSGQYRVDMKTTDPVYIERLSGYVGSENDYCFGTSLLSALRTDAKQQALSKARDLKVNVPVMLGEGRQTVNMLADTARTLGRAYRSFRRGRFRQAADQLGIPFSSVTDKGRGAANHWLAYSYGWMPLLSDAKGLLKLAEKGLLDSDRGPRFSVRSSTQMTKNIDRTTEGQGAGNLPGGQTKHRGFNVATARAGLLLEYKPGASGLTSVGMGSFDPLLMAWELTPFSFVFDWFIDVGSWLENLSTLQDVTVLAGFESHVEDIYFVSTMERPGTSGWTTPVKPRGFTTWRSYRRYNWLGSVSLRTPLWDGFNARRLTTTAALWRQRTRGDRVPGGYRP